MSPEDNATFGKEIQDLRSEMMTETAVEAAPTVSRKRTLKLAANDVAELKKLAVRALIMALLVVVITQIVFQTVMLPRQYRGGPISMEAAVEQLGDDLLPTPAPPPSLRP